MDEAENSKYCAMVQEHLGALTSFGRVFLASIEGAAAILEQDYLGVIQLSDDQKKEFLEY